MDILERIKRVRAFVFDVDGVMTDGNLLLLDNGEWLRQMNMKDGFAIKYATDKRFRVCAISGSGSDAIVKRLTALGVKDIYINVENKLMAYERLILDYGVSIEETLYMGDDIPDLPAMQNAGLAACPSDAVPEIKAAAHYIAQNPGGRGCVREVIEMVMRAHDQWDVLKS